MMHSIRKLLIFTDLDGTLLDYHTYSLDAARPALKRIEELNIPLVIVSSKTRSEIEALIDNLPINPQVFIVENSSAIFFLQDAGEENNLNLEKTGAYFMLRLGIPYEYVLKGLQAARKECKASVRGFSDMSVQEISSLTGLDLPSAARAKTREFSEPFLFAGLAEEFRCLSLALEKRGLTSAEGGRFWHALGKCDKGMAVRNTLRFYQDISPHTAWKTIGLGDSPNDFPMLGSVDTAILVKRYDATSADYPGRPGQEIIKAPAMGPSGWNLALLDVIEKEGGTG